jgi:hypothetical protein
MSRLITPRETPCNAITPRHANHADITPRIVDDHVNTLIADHANTPRHANTLIADHAEPIYFYLSFVDELNDHDSRLYVYSIADSLCFKVLGLMLTLSKSDQRKNKAAVVITKKSDFTSLKQRYRLPYNFKGSVVDECRRISLRPTQIAERNLQVRMCQTDRAL